VTATLIQFGLPLALLAVLARAIAAWLPRLVLGVMALVVVLALAQSIPGTDSSSRTIDTTAEASMAASDAIPIPWADAPPRWESKRRCPDALAPDASLPQLEARVDQLDALRDEWARNHGTIAIVRAEHPSGTCRDFIATQMSTNAEPAVRSALLPGEVPVWSGTGLPDGWNVMHAEQKAVFAATMAGFRPVSIASSRPFCDDGRAAGRTSCQTWLRATGAIARSDRTAAWAW
jgi:hypothetical protein